MSANIGAEILKERFALVEQEASKGKIRFDNSRVESTKLKVEQFISQARDYVNEKLETGVI